MPFETVQLGSAPAGAGGDDNRTAFTRINSNFAGIKSRGLDEYMGADLGAVSILAGYPTGKYYFAANCTDGPVANWGFYCTYTKRYFTSSPTEYVVEAVSYHGLVPRKFINRTVSGVWSGWVELYSSNDLAPAWKPVTLLNGYTAWGAGWNAPAYRVLPFGIQLRGLLKTPAAGGPKNSAVCKIPYSGVSQAFATTQNEAYVSWYFNSDGSISPQQALPTTGWVSLDGVLLSP